jgi:hypothetical protein
VRLIIVAARPGSLALLKSIGKGGWLAHFESAVGACAASSRRREASYRALGGLPIATMETGRLAPRCRGSQARGWGNQWLIGGGILLADSKDVHRGVRCLDRVQRLLAHGLYGRRGVPDRQEHP